MACKCHHCLFKQTRGKSICLSCTLKWRKYDYSITLIIFERRLGIDISRYILRYLKYYNSCTSECSLSITRLPCDKCYSPSVRMIRRISIPQKEYLYFTDCEIKYRWSEPIKRSYCINMLCRKCYRKDKIKYQRGQKLVPNDLPQEKYNIPQGDQFIWNIHAWYIHGKWQRYLDKLY